MTKKSVSLFYSKNANANLGSIIKNALNRYDVYTIYVQDIDDVILKKFTEIDMLVLDFVEEKLDDRSMHLIMRLFKSKYIKRILIVGKGENVYEDIPYIKYDEDFNVNIAGKIESVLSINIEEKKVYDASWIKVIGDYLLDIGFSLRHIGYSMIIDAVIYVLVDDCVMKSLSNDIYPYLANKYDKKVTSIELDMRKAISLAYANSKNFPLDYCPSIKEFLRFMVKEISNIIFSKKVI